VCTCAAWSGLPQFSLRCLFAVHACCALQDGVVLAADTRSTSGSTVADKNCEKIHYIAPNIYCCGAGTAADTENVTGAPWLCCQAYCCVANQQQPTATYPGAATAQTEFAICYGVQCAQSILRHGRQALSARPALDNACSMQQHLECARVCPDSPGDHQQMHVAAMLACASWLQR
jgi:hypothetical protein